MRLSLVELQVLAGLTAGRTLSQIATDLSLGQPAVSKILRSAERHLGISLVRHHGRRVRLTTAGLQLGQKAQLIVAQLRGLEESVTDLRSGRSGQLRIAATTIPGNYVLPALISEFLSAHPDVEISLRIVAGRDWRVALNEGIDIGFGTNASAPDGWLVDAVGEDEVVFFAAPDSPLAGRSVDWEELSRQTIVAPFEVPFWSEILTKLASDGLTIKRRIDLRALDGIKLIVENGHGVGVTLGSAVERDIAADRFRRIHVANFRLLQKYYLARPEDLHGSPLAEAFCACVRRSAVTRHMPTTLRPSTSRDPEPTTTRDAKRRA